MLNTKLKTDEMMDIKEIWQNEFFLSQNLKIEDINNLLDYIAPFLISMELKFLWDHSINDVGLSSFINTAMQKMYKIVINDYKNDYELYPKQRDFESLWEIIVEYPIDNSIQKGDKIWKLIINKITEIAEEVLD
ncbi:MAG: hypothetical protein ACLRMG_01380 [Clostridium sp.]